MAGMEIETTTLNIVEGLGNNGGEDERGICLTWKDLWVTASSKNGGRSKSILQGLTGYAKTGQLLAIMGPSGCGKSTLLDTLAGRLGSNTRQTGEILVNGHKQALAYGTSAYVTQDDTLYTTLTVREAVYYSAQLQLPDSMSKQEKKERAELTIREMGLQDAMNTRIGGGWGSKGISGGQKRRVSICIEILTRPRLLFLDEPTSGLDSAASYYVMRAIARLGQKDGIQRTIIASIHQPSSEVFQLFHNLCLLSSGRNVYFGPASSASEFFASNGFPCPTLQNPSDHYLKTINKDFDQESGWSMRMKSKGHSGFLSQCSVLTKRSSVNMCRDRGYYWLRLFTYIVQAISLATVFYDIGTSYESIQVFERERLNGHYGVTSFVIGNTLSSIPYLILVSLIPGVIVYYPSGLQRSLPHFIYFFCVLFSCLMLVESLMMIVASIVPNFLMGIITGAGIQGIMILGGGFFRLPHDLPRIFWKYPMYYLAFHRYAYQGLFKNEFEGLSFPSSPSKRISGEVILRSKWEVDMRYSKWVDVGVLVGMIVLYRVLFLVIIKGTEKVKPIVASLLSMPPKRSMQDLWVRASSGKSIIQALTGYAKPGQLLAIMGPSGKSTLLDALAESLMMIVASIVPNFLMGIITGAGIQGMMMLAGGFFRLPNDLPRIFWKYPMYYFAFHRYAYQGLFKNEFEGLRFPNSSSSSSKRMSFMMSGEEILRGKWEVEMRYSKWVDFGILVGMIVLYRVIFLVIIKGIEKVKPLVAHSFCFVHPKRTMQVMEKPNATPLHVYLNIK
ncbi:ABC transporter G family member 11-like [Senna tora]|uniref:ABC transporter G family member 11-like n=1 Tax=Senna tora TaxID=362788 RepID=A0A834XCL4_9FABA|nr:ABC transporter G family member 11-like [Senna tora]